MCGDWFCLCYLRCLLFETLLTLLGLLRSRPAVPGAALNYGPRDCHCR